MLRFLHWKLIQIQKFQKARGRPDGRTDGHIILPLRGIDFVACGLRRCAQLQATRMIAKKRMAETTVSIERQRDRETERQRDGRTEI